MAQTKLREPAAVVPLLPEILPPGGAVAVQDQGARRQEEAARRRAEPGVEVAGVVGGIALVEAAQGQHRVPPIHHVRRGGEGPAGVAEIARRIEAAAEVDEARGRRGGAQARRRAGGAQRLGMSLDGCQQLLEPASGRHAVGVGEGDPGTLGRAEARIARCRRTLLALSDHLHAVPPGELGAAIGRAVVDEDDLVVGPRQALAGEGHEAGLEIVPAIVDRDDDGSPEAHGGAIRPARSMPLKKPRHHHQVQARW